MRVHSGHVLHLPRRTEIASGEGWCISDIVCSAGPRDRPYEESHTCPCIAIVAAGTFQYRSARKPDLMVPGSILLGNAGDCFCCGHEHGTGDRCICFSYDSGWFERVVHEAEVTEPVLGPRVYRRSGQPIRSQLGFIRYSRLLLAAGVRNSPLRWRYGLRKWKLGWDRVITLGRQVR
ncbi:MAG: hypothetical protein JO182_18975 [Acidobacteriaceae bacterium]|nr:hypothetical protein [Acidobacteriaceae bacterium]